MGVQWTFLTIIMNKTYLITSISGVGGSIMASLFLAGKDVLYIAQSENLAPTYRDGLWLHIIGALKKTII